jgi:hypothetical protein
MLSLKELSDSTLRYMQFHVPNKVTDFIVAFADTQAVAIQYTSRQCDPRTGFRITDKQELSLSCVEYALFKLTLYDMSQATMLDDQPFGQYQQRLAQSEIEWAFACHADQLNWAGNKMHNHPVWALIVERIPDPNTEPTILQPAPVKKQRKSKQFVPSPVIGTEEESNEGEEETQADG